MLRSGHGVYRAAGPTGGLDSLVAAAHASRGVVACDSAASVHGWDLAHSPRGHSIVVPRNRRTVRRPGVRQHRMDLSPGDWVEIGGVRVTAPLRTVLDCGRRLPLVDAVAVADAALRAGLDLRGLVEAAALARGHGAGRVRRMAALCDPRAGSVLESVARVLMVSAGLPPSHTQYVLRDAAGALIAVADFAYEAARLLVETDGFDYHRERRDYRADRRKANAFLLGGWMLLRFSWEDVLLDPAYVVSTVRAALDLRLAPAA